MRGRLVHDGGAYVPWGIVLPLIAATTVPGPYVIPSFKLDVTVAFTNKMPTSPVRGAGRPQAVFVMERLMDRRRARSRLDRAEVRRRNLIQPEQMPYEVGLIFRDGRPVTYDSGDYPACQDKALELADYGGFRSAAGGGARGGPLHRHRHRQCGRGTGLGPYEGATVRVVARGKIACSPARRRRARIAPRFAQIAADQLGVAPETIDVVTADTDAIALGVGTFASRTAVNAGPAVASRGEARAPTRSSRSRRT